MAYVSAAAGTTTLTQSSSSHGGHSDWGMSPKGKMRNDYEDASPVNGSFGDDSMGYNGNHSGYEQYGGEPGTGKENHPRIGRTTSATDSKRSRNEQSQSRDLDEQSKWIHRDKLAKIESEELQAAGIVLPRVRAQSRPRRDRSQDKAGLIRRDTDSSLNHYSRPASRKNSVQRDRSPDVEIPSWDLRLPEEIEQESKEQYWIQNDSGKGSRIPIAKLSPAPISAEYLDRDAPIPRKPSQPMLQNDDQSSSWTKDRSGSGSSAVLDEASKSPTTSRSATEGSPKKAAQPGTRKTSAPATKTTPQSRQKTRSGSNPTAARSTSTTRPTTRSGELKAPEGEPPWMISAYKPDPRLPPDQQLLPTVAKRLQQEKWESEGKFGNVYDTEFRPLNEQTLLKPPELQKPKPPADEPEQPAWPLRADAKSPTVGSRPGTSSYSTMPKLQDKPAHPPMPSPRVGPPPQQPAVAVQQRPEPTGVAQEKQKKKKGAGCGCCLVM